MKKTNAKSKAGKNRHGKRTKLAEVNAWISANHAALLKKARQNCLRLTGRPTFGGVNRRKSA